MQNEFVIQKLANGLHCILLDSKLAKLFVTKNNNRCICTINKQLSFHCAIMPQKEGGFFVTIGLKICKQLGIGQGSTIWVSFKTDDTTYQFEMPEEFEEVLQTDEAANKIFKSLTPGNQRGLIYLVAKVKSTDKKIEKALVIAEQIKIGNTSPRTVFKK